MGTVCVRVKGGEGGAWAIAYAALAQESISGECVRVTIRTDFGLEIWIEGM